MKLIFDFEFIIIIKSDIILIRIDLYFFYKLIKMVFVPRISLKTGINPSILRSFPVDGSYNGTQKLMLVRTRIFGTKIG
jgi:hypothetical protein